MKKFVSLHKLIVYSDYGLSETSSSASLVENAASTRARLCIRHHRSDPLCLLRERRQLLVYTQLMAYVHGYFNPLLSAAWSERWENLSVDEVKRHFVHFYRTSTISSRNNGHDWWHHQPRSRSDDWEYFLDHRSFLPYSNLIQVQKTQPMINSTVHFHLSLNDLHLSVFFLVWYFEYIFYQIRCRWECFETVHLRIFFFFLNALIIYCPITEWNIFEGKIKKKSEEWASVFDWLVEGSNHKFSSLFARTSDDGGRGEDEDDECMEMLTCTLFLADWLVAIHVHHTWLDDTHPL